MRKVCMAGLICFGSRVYEIGIIKEFSILSLLDWSVYVCMYNHDYRFLAI